MKWVLGTFTSPTTDDERTVVSAMVVTSGNFGTFGTAAFWTDYQVAEGRACTLSIIGTACTASLCFYTSLSCRMSLMSHRLMTFYSLYCAEGNMVIFEVRNNIEL